MVNVNNLVVECNNKRILNAISCSLLPGRITCFIGKSGAGKTTLLKSLVDLMPITAGTITINGTIVGALTHQERAATIGYVFQQFNLFANMTVLENCIDPLLVHGTHPDEAAQRVRMLLSHFDVLMCSEQYPQELSGGQQQRVAIVRALCLNPGVLLLDEPTASLDPLNTDILVKELRELAAQGLTIGVSSQDMAFVRKIFDRVYYLEAGNSIEFCDGVDALKNCFAIQKFM